MTEDYRIERLGFTGTRDITRADTWDIARFLFNQRWLHESEPEIIVGACVGVDALIARLAHAMGLYVRAIVPPNRTLVDPEFSAYANACEFIEPGADGYKRRNQRIVDLSDAMIAFPAHREDHPDSRRSGTWQTIRMAKRRGIPFVIAELNR